MWTTEVHDVRGGPGCVGAAVTTGPVEGGGVPGDVAAAVGVADGAPADDELDPSIHGPTTVRTTTRAAGIATAPRNLMRRGSYPSIRPAAWRAGAAG